MVVVNSNMGDDFKTLRMQTITVSRLEKQSPLVVQSNRLIESRYSLTTGEQRLIMAMISLIHPNDQDFKPYILKIQDLAVYLNIDIKNAYREADKITSRLMERVLHIPEPDGSLLKVHWVSSARHEKGKVTIKFDPDLKPYLLQLKKQFTRYQLTIIAQFQSTYTIRIYSLLKQYQQIGYREIDILELREILGIKENEYPRFDNFKARVLNQAKKEFETKINKGKSYKSDITFDLETIRTGRKITRLRFNIKKQSYQEELPMIYEEAKPPQIQKMVYFGISEKQAIGYFQKFGAEAIENALDLYGERLQSGKVKNQTGAYLKKLIEEGAGTKSEYEKQLEKETKLKAIEQAKKKEEQAKLEQKKAENYQQKKERLLAKFEALPKKKKEKLLKEFENSLIPVMQKTYRKSGLDSPMISGTFNHFLAEKDK